MLVFSYSISVLILITACFALPSQNVTVNNSNNGSLPELPSPDHISCLPRVYGVNPKKASCVNAWEKIPRTITEDMYTSRSRATTVSITIPIRYQSDDGRCVIDVRAKRRDTVVTGDLSRGIDISDAAGSIIDKCMQPQSRFTSGGSIYGFSLHSELLLVISKYESKATCATLPRKIASPYACEQVLQEIPTSLQTVQFIDQKDRPSRTAYSKLPKYHENGDCELLISRNPVSGSSMDSWYDIWAAGVDILTMCVEQGTTGTVLGLGDNRQIRVDLGDTHLPDDQL